MPQKGWEHPTRHDLDEVVRPADEESLPAWQFDVPGTPPDDLVGGDVPSGGVESGESWGGGDWIEPPAPQEFARTLPQSGSLVRPYTKTGGRTRTSHDLAVETLVVTSEQGKAQVVGTLPEHRSICSLCVETRSVAEVSAHLRLPLGVTKVLIDDLADLGLVHIHQNDLVVGDQPSVEIMERVLSGLRRL